MPRVLTFGTFDLFHIGHVNILERAKEMGDVLIVGLSSDQLNLSKKERFPIYSFSDRKRILESCVFVDEVFQEDSLEQKREYILEHKADILVMGCDWEGHFDVFNDICRVVYLPRTDGISSTQTLAKICEQA